MSDEMRGTSQVARPDLLELLRDAYICYRNGNVAEGEASLIAAMKSLSCVCDECTECGERHYREAQLRAQPAPLSDSPSETP